MAGWTPDLEALEKKLTAVIKALEARVSAVETVNRDQGKTLLDLSKATEFLQQHRMRIAQRDLDGRVSTAIPMEGGTLFSVVTEVQEPGAVHPPGSVVVARDVTLQNAARLGSASFWCDGAALKCSGTSAVHYRVIFVTHGTLPE